MLAHFDAEMISDVSDIVYRLNAFLPSDIAVQDIFETNSEAHARFDAISRTYEYWIVQEKNPFLRHHAHYIKYPLDIDKMNKAAQILLENTDFECFSKSNTDVYTFLCNISQAKWKPKNDVLVFTITADRFLRNMVRAIVGTLLEVGLGKMELETVNAIIKSKNRSNAGVSVPAKGLYLTQVIYPEKIKKIDG
jgi:tRNA pseudouridine38-40 synthase